MLKVYQFHLNDEDRKLINSAGWDSSPKSVAYLKNSMPVTTSRFNTDDFKYFTHVANVYTDSLEHAFSLMNLWEDEELIARLGECRSMSVGDIVQTEDGQFYRCAALGFDPIQVNL